MITKYGASVVLTYLVLATVLVIGTVWLIQNDAIQDVVITGTIVVTILVLNFFRDPHRTTPSGDHLVVSPADGKVVVIKDVYEPEYLKQDAVQISIFMSPLNVHVNRFPISGTIGYFRHIPGEYLVAFDDKSSDRNERTLIGIEDEGRKVLFKQIAGTVARRIVADLAVGLPARIGERFGMIRFGSRVDVLMPKGSLVHVKLRDRVKAGETVLAATNTAVPRSASIPADVQRQGFS